MDGREVRDVKPMLNILWLNNDQMGCGVYRCYVPALTLQERQVADNDFLLNREITSTNVTALNDRDIVVFQRCATPAALHWVKVCKERGIWTVFETDDDVLHIPGSNPSHSHWQQKPVRKHLREILSLTDLVITSTQPLKDALMAWMKWPTGENIRVCPNHLHPSIWGDQIIGRVTPFANVNLKTGQPYTVIGWQGSRTHDEDFKVALPALTRLLNERPDVQIRFFGCVPLSVKGAIPGDRFQFVNGVPFERYPDALRYLNFDIGIAPLQPTTFNRSKSNVKWLEYSALSIPAVCSKVYPYAKSISHGETGFLAETTEDWYCHLSALLDSPQVRHDIGAAARQAAWRTFGPEQATKWADAFVSLRQQAAA